MGENYRLRYHSGLCSRHYHHYTTGELAYLCYWYGHVSSREIALSLGRTQKSILNKAERLKKSGQFDEFRQMYENRVLLQKKISVMIGREKMKENRDEPFRY